LIKITDKNKEAILLNYCQYVLDNMDLHTILESAYNNIKDNKNLMSNQDLEYEILQIYPEILEK
jgi:uncharacterized protein YfbU (UPF0304 family)